MKKFFTIVALLLVFSTQIAFANEQTTKVKCEKPASGYLKDAEYLYKESVNSNFVEYKAMHAARVTAAALLYQICSELEKNTTMTPPPPPYSKPSGRPATPDPTTLFN